MPKAGVDFTGRVGWVYGWGYTRMDGNIANFLRCVGRSLNIAAVKKHKLVPQGDNTNDYQQ